MAKVGSKNVRMGIWLITAIAALNWALVEFFNTDLLIDVIALSGSNLTIAYGVIGAAAAAGLYNLVLNDIL